MDDERKTLRKRKVNGHSDQPVSFTTGWVGAVLTSQSVCILTDGSVWSADQRHLILTSGSVGVHSQLQQGFRRVDGSGPLLLTSPWSLSAPQPGARKPPFYVGVGERRPAAGEWGRSVENLWKTAGLD